MFLDLLFFFFSWTLKIIIFIIETFFDNLGNIFKITINISTLTFIVNCYNNGLEYTYKAIFILIVIFISLILSWLVVWKCFLSELEFFQELTGKKNNAKKDKKYKYKYIIRGSRNNFCNTKY